jgi:hypothetical protein
MTTTQTLYLFISKFTLFVKLLCPSIGVFLIAACVAPGRSVLRPATSGGAIVKLMFAIVPVAILSACAATLPAPDPQDGTSAGPLSLPSSVVAQNEDSTAITKMPGWGVQAYRKPWQLGWTPHDRDRPIAEAFHFSPDGSFYEVSDEGFQLAIAVTFDAKQEIKNHEIPVDASCVVDFVLDEKPVENIVNTHRIVELDFTKGEHTLMILNNCCREPECWMALVVGKCLWGTDKNIDFVKSGGFPWSK